VQNVAFYLKHRNVSEHMAEVNALLEDDRQTA